MMWDKIIGSKKKTLVVLVDEHDQEIGVAEKLIAHQQGLRHRAFSIFLLNQTEQGVDVLLQQRQHDKYHCPSYWSNACCSHPLPGESTADAADRRLQEELGISVPLHYAGVFHYRAALESGLIEDEVDHVFYGYYDQLTVPFNTAEVAATKWLPHTAWDTAPEPLTPWVKEAWSLVASSLDLKN